ncbi:MAG: lipoyl(octanoyl) transferase LipB [Gemmatimonadota bacterium]
MKRTSQRTATTAAARQIGQRRLRVERLGRVPYAEGLALQERLVADRRAGRAPDTLLLLEHPHVITLGTSADRAHILVDDAEATLLGLDIFETGRGGDVTYHGPGQLVGYPILDLKPDRCDLHQYVRDLEEVLIRALAASGIEAGRKQGLTGAWVGSQKIAAIGVRVSSGWITSHGFALNVSTDIAFFDSIVPCGIRDRGVCSMESLLEREVRMEEVEGRVTSAFREVFDSPAY